NKFVTDIRPQKCYSYRFQRELKADIAHQRRHYGRICKFSVALYISRHDPQRRVAVDYTAFLIDKKCPVGVAVERHAEIGSFSQYSFPETVQMQRTTVFVNIMSTGLIVDHNHIRAQT